jgi:hypothetical protein
MRFMPLLCLLALAGCGATPTKPDAVPSTLANTPQEVYYASQVPGLAVSLVRLPDVLRVTLTPTRKAKFDPTLPGCWTFALFLSTDESFDRDDYSGWDHVVNAMPWCWSRSDGAGLYRITADRAWAGPPKQRVRVKFPRASGVTPITFDVPLAAIADDGSVLYQVQALATFVRPDGSLGCELVKVYNGRSSIADHLGP